MPGFITKMSSQLVQILESCKGIYFIMFDCSNNNSKVSYKSHFLEQITISLTYCCEVYI